ncbi:DUF4835 family protein [Flavobacteriaceae bacterium XHP0103]|uniref:type IX secretion system protein PorD n=1 Tax=Marixanthotalea marina TaxID=2844359 RepID=UPI002989CC08|nr:DUF4835 family protein [Marixanthotalea marina]MBU3822568.1 DUF4835 family protein [Marixanthotalea marina]
MRSFILSFFLMVTAGIVFAQELNCNLVVNARQTGNENQQVFKTLESQLTEFINNTKWTDKTFSPQERINCSMTITINNYSGETFQGSIQVQSSRPIYGSSYTTPLYNFNDSDFTFRYLEFQNLLYSPTQYQSNLVSVLAFHVYMILALDADSFSKNGGQIYYKQAQTISNYSQQENFKGWKLEDGLQSRFALIDNVLSTTFREFRDVVYTYHREGLDLMSDNPKTGKENIAEALKQFDTMNRRRPNSFLLRTFFDAKADEIQQIFSDGPNINIASLKETLQKVAPLHNSKWQNIKF